MFSYNFIICISILRCMPMCSFCFRGPQDTCFEGGIFPAILSFPSDYPLSPPKMRFTCEMFHPNSEFHPPQILVPSYELELHDQTCLSWSWILILKTVRMCLLIRNSSIQQLHQMYERCFKVHLPSVAHATKVMSACLPWKPLSDRLLACY